MKRRWLTKRVLKWVGASLCGLLDLSFVASRWWAFGCAAGGWFIGIERGTMAFGHGPEAETGLACTRIEPPEIIWSWPFWIDRAVPYGFVALWIPFLVLLIPTALLWRLDRRIPPGHCQICGYDLTGNVNGRCPECGETMAPDGEGT